MREIEKSRTEINVSRKFGEYEKVLYLLLTHGYIPKKNLIYSIKSTTQAFTILRRAEEEQHIRPFIVTIKVNYRNRQIKAYRITRKGLDYLMTIHPPETQKEIGWITILQQDQKVTLRNERSLPGKSLARYLQVSMTSTFMASMGAAIREVYADEFDADGQQLGNVYQEDIVEASRYLELDELNLNLPQDLWEKNENPLPFDVGLQELQSPHRKDESSDQPPPEEGRHLSSIVRNAKRTYFGPLQYRETPILNADSKLIFYDVHTVKRTLATNGADPYEYRRDRMTGIITSPMRSALVYASYQGTLTWRAWNYHHEARCLYNFVMRHTPYQNVRDDLRLGVLLIGSPKDLEKIYRPYLQEYRSQFRDSCRYLRLGDQMDQFLVVPMDRNGQRNCSEFLTSNLGKTQREIRETGLRGGMLPGPVDHRATFMWTHPKDGSYVFLGIFMDIIRINQLLQFQENSSHPFGILCHTWQVEYYQRLFPDAYYLLTDQEGANVNVSDDSPGQGLESKL